MYATFMPTTNTNLIIKISINYVFQYINFFLVSVPFWTIPY